LSGSCGGCAGRAEGAQCCAGDGLFADRSSWSEVIARLQSAGLNVTSVQNPLTTLPEAVASAERVLARTLAAAAVGIVLATIAFAKAARGAPHKRKRSRIPDHIG
jgi:hypothetical protein